MVKTPVDEYSIHDEQPALVLRDVEAYDSFARVAYRGSSKYVHVQRLKKVPSPSQR